MWTTTTTRFRAWRRSTAGFGVGLDLLAHKHDAYPQVDKSPIVIALANANSKLFRCPMDTDNSARIARLEAENDTQNGPYLYSYSMTSYNVTSTDDGNGNTQSVNPGMTSVFTSSENLPFKLSAIRKPVSKIMFAEEVASSSNSDNPTGGKVINDGRWVPSEGDPLTSRHGGKGDVTFADFHVEPETWEFGTMSTIPNRICEMNLPPPA